MILVNNLQEMEGGGGMEGGLAFTESIASVTLNLLANLWDICWIPSPPLVMEDPSIHPSIEQGTRAPAALIISKFDLAFRTSIVWSRRRCLIRCTQRSRAVRCCWARHPPNRPLIHSPSGVFSALHPASLLAALAGQGKQRLSLVQRLIKALLLFIYCIYRIGGWFLFLLTVSSVRF